MAYSGIVGTSPPDGMRSIRSRVTGAVRACWVVTMLSDEQLLEIQRVAVDDAMHAANTRDGYGSNVSRESIVAGLRAVVAAVRADMQRGVRTIEELDALPDGTVVMAPDGYATNISDSFITGEWMLPATVLFTPSTPNQTGAEQ